MAPRENTKNNTVEESRIQLRLREIQVMKELKQMELEEIRMQRKQLEENAALQHTQTNHDQEMIEQNKARNEKPDEHVLDPVPDVSSRSTTTKTKEKTM
ncbi:hypothetical protein B0O99DRAFT_630662 [Bisporella sp. PMI_857]|nr:hypothetical protein B0O99DRAFT_630662 [Bisporella sp. PMI_857]